MRIATWNVERLKHLRELNKINHACENSNADILVLTETDVRIAPPHKYTLAAPFLADHLGVEYKKSERLVSIHSNFPTKRIIPTFNAFSAVCVEQNSSIGSFLLYGVVIGRFGNRHSEFLQDVRGVCHDIDLFTSKGLSLCICGDYNLSFCDNYYYTKEGRRLLLNCFERNHIKLVTGEQPECIDHIAISESMIGSTNPEVNEWNLDKKLSDHKGIVVSV